MINEKNFFLESKKINVSNTSSLVNLKAELFKKKQDAIKVRSSKKEEFESINATKNVSNSKWNQKAVQLDQKVRESIQNIKAQSTKNSENSYVEKELKKSKENLERKAKIYEEKLKNAYDSLLKNNEERNDADDNLVDFERKILDSSIKGFKLFDLPQKSKTDCALDLEEMVEYQDSFGRTRYCKRKELNKIIKLNEEDLLRRKLDRDLTRDEIKTDSDLNSNLYSNFIKSTLVEETSESSHYQNVSKGEIREHGISYYQFSLNEEERKKQMQELENLRNKTIEQRKKAAEKLEKHNQAIKQRLLKLAKRKGIIVEEDLFDEEETSKRMKLDQFIKQVPKSNSPDKNYLSDIESTNLNDQDCLVISKERKLREWDKDKLKKTGFNVDKKSLHDVFETNNKLSDVEFNDDQFAPPSSYESKIKNQKKSEGELHIDQTLEDKIENFLNQFK